MNESKLIKDALGQKILHCFYNEKLKNWNEAIRKAKAKHGVKDGVTILCKPKR